jgi:hypothetical protein
MIEPTPGFVDHSLPSGELPTCSKAVATSAPRGDSLNIIAIDPGTTESAILEWDGNRILMAEIWPNNLCRDWVKDAGPGRILVVEMVACYGMAVGKEVFETCLFIGRIQECAIRNTLLDNFKLVYRRDVKLHHCGSARAKDANIRQALIDKYGAPGTKKAPGRTYGLKSHLWAAFALATYASETRFL